MRRPPATPLSAWVSDGTMSVENQRYEDGTPAVRYPKRRVALMFGYSGADFFGLQFNSDRPSVEGVLYSACVKAKLVLPSNAVNPNKVGINRAGRTDKGVSAARQVVSLKLMIPPEKDDTKVIKSLINLHLPKEIRVWNVVYVPPGFNARTYCNSRKYEYFLPSFMLGKHHMSPDFTGCSGSRDVAPVTLEEQLSYRISSERLAEFESTLKVFLGTHRYHNYSSGFKPEDRKSRRYLIEASCEVIQLHGQEFMRVCLHGQSFILHQIRKMIAFLIVSMRYETETDFILETFKFDRIQIPRAPGLGLFLEEPVFSNYNDLTSKKAMTVEDENVDDQAVSKFKLLSVNDNEDEITEFKQRVIYEKILEEDRSKAVFSEWTHLLDRFVHCFQFFGPRNANLSVEQRREVARILNGENCKEKIGL